MAEPSGIDPADPKGAEPGGTPSAEQKAKRLEQEVADLKKQLEEAKGQVTTLTENLGKALTEDDVKTAVEAAKQEAAAAASQREKRLVVENELIKARCIDTAGAIAHIDMDGVQIAPDGHVSGLDVSKLAKDCGHLGSSPRMRGARLFMRVTVLPHGIIPAYAGSTIGRSIIQAAIGDHPRVCGEHLRCWRWLGRYQGSSPRMRGALLQKRERLSQIGIIPAYAGSTRVIAPFARR